MQITRQADYAVRAVLYLAHQKISEREATSTIAVEQRIPPSSWQRSFGSYPGRRGPAGGSQSAQFQLAWPGRQNSCFIRL